MAKYPYSILPIPSGGQVFKPLISVRLIYKKTHKLTAPVYGLIDSGADVCFCSQDIGLWLGINFKNKKPISFTAANNKAFLTFKEVISLQVCRLTYDCPFYFSAELPPKFPIILGQIGFFDHFKVNFDLRKKEIEII